MRLHPDVKHGVDVAVLALQQCWNVTADKMEEAVFAATKGCDALFYTVMGGKQEWLW